MTTTQTIQNATSYGTLLNYCDKTDCKLYFYNGVYYFISPLTGYHSIKQESYNNHGFMNYASTSNRVKLHWEGFLQNQERA